MSAAPRDPVRSPTGFRWTICGLLVCVSANSYLDRQTLGVLAPELIDELGWDAADYATIVFWFQLGFAIGFPLTGRFIDAIGTRWGYAIAVLSWSAVSLWHGMLGSLAAFKCARLALGLTQPSNMPAGVKTVAEWFPPRERATAMGIFKGGANVGAILVPLVVPLLYHAFGWRTTFVLVASTGFAWVLAWLAIPPRRGPAADSSTAVRETPPWRTLLVRRETWAYMNFKFMTDAVWHWYLAMLPLFLSRRFGLQLTEFGLPLIAVYGLGFLGSVAGGGLSSRWIARGWDVIRARKTAMLVCCAATVPVLLVTRTHDLWLCILLIGLAHAAHQGLTSNLFTMVSDVFPRQVVGTVVGLGGTAAQCGAALMTLATAWVLRSHSDLTVLFFVTGTAYVLAFAVFHWLVPHLRPIDLPGCEAAADVRVAVTDPA